LQRRQEQQSEEERTHRDHQFRKRARDQEERRFSDQEVTRRYEANEELAREQHLVRIRNVHREELCNAQRSKNTVDWRHSYGGLQEFVRCIVVDANNSHLIVFLLQMWNLIWSDGVVALLLETKKNIKTQPPPAVALLLETEMNIETAAWMILHEIGETVRSLRAANNLLVSYVLLT